MAKLLRADSYPPSEGFKYIDVDQEEALSGENPDWRCIWAYERTLEFRVATPNPCENSLQAGLSASRPPVPVACGVRCDQERGSLPSPSAAASAAQPAAVFNASIPFVHKKAGACGYDSPFRLPSVQQIVMETTDADSQAGAAEDGAWAEDVSPQGSCEVGAATQQPPECLPIELPVAPAEPAPPALTEAASSAPAEAAALLPERESTKTLFVDIDAFAPSAELAAGHFVQQRPLIRVSQAASSVCRIGDEDSDDSDDAVDKIITIAVTAATTAAKGLRRKFTAATTAAKGPRRKSSGCLPAATASEQATAAAEDEKSETVDAMEIEEPQVSVQAAPPAAGMPSASASQAPHVEGPWRSVSGEGDGCTSMAVAESPYSGRGKTTRGAARAPHRGRSAAAAPPAMPRRSMRRAAAGAAAAVAAARLDIVEEEADEEEVEVDEEDGDEEFDVSARPSLAGVKRRRKGAAGPRTARRVVSGNVCRECGTTETPQWRRGPLGDRTLCNACGVRYAKMKKSGAIPQRKGA